MIKIICKLLTLFTVVCSHQIPQLDFNNLNITHPRYEKKIIGKNEYIVRVLYSTAASSTTSTTQRPATTWRLIWNSNSSIRYSDEMINYTFHPLLEMSNITTTTQKSQNDDNYDYYPLYDSDHEPNESSSLKCDDVEFECRSDHWCIPLENYCDGEIDCIDGSDELFCAQTPAIGFKIINDTVKSVNTHFNMSVKSSLILTIITMGIIIMMFAYEKLKKSSLKSTPHRLQNDEKSIYEAANLQNSSSQFEE